MNFKIMNYKNLDENTICLLKKEVTCLEPIFFNLEKSNFVLIDNDVIGIYAINIFNNNSAELRYGIFKEYQNKGIGTSFLKYITNYLFKENKKYEKLYLYIHYDNHISKRVAEKNDFDIDYSKIEECALFGEGTELFPFYKINPYLEKNKTLVK